jgi:hypothetical protein
VTYLAIQAVVVKRVIGIGGLAQASSVLRGVVAASLMAAVVYPLGQAASPAVALAIGIPLGALVHFTALRLFFPDDLRFLVSRVLQRRRAVVPVTEP